MTHKKKNGKQVHLTKEQLMQRELSKSFMKKFQTDAEDQETVLAKECPSPVLCSAAASLAPRRDRVKSCSKPVKPASKSVPSNALLLTIDDLGVLLQVSRSTINRMAKSGELPGRVLLGGVVRYHRPTVETWIAERVKLT